MEVTWNGASLNRHEGFAYKIGPLCIVSGQLNSRNTGGGLLLASVPVRTLARTCAPATMYGGNGTSWSGKAYAEDNGGGSNIFFDIPAPSNDYAFLLVFPCA